MDQADFETALRTTLLRHLPAEWNWPISRANQKSTGRDDGVYFFLVNDGKRGWQSRKYPNMEKLVESQIAEKMYQFYTLISDETKGTANDVINVVRMTLASLPMVEDLQAQGIGVQRPTDVLNPVFVNDRDQYDSNPNFTIIFTHTRNLELNVPFTSVVEPSLQRF